MVDFSGGYVPPGVSVDSESTNSLSAVGIGNTVVCLVGTGVGYQTYTENVSFSAANGVELTKKYIDTDSIVVSANLDTGLTVFIKDASVDTQHDYAVTADSGTHLTAVTRHPAGTIPTDRLVTVTYHFTDDDYYGVNKFADFASLVAVYGPPLNPVTGDIQSPLAFGAQLAFRNGANVIYCVALDARVGGTAQEQFASAYDKTMDNFEINLVVPLWSAVQNASSATSYVADLSGHLQAAYSANMPRMGLAGVGQQYVTTDIDSVATSVAYRRVVLFWPQAFTYFNSVLNGTAIADGYYFAAAMSGVMVDQDISRGITHSSVNTFTGIAPPGQGYTLSQKNTWSSRGVAVAETNRTGALIIRHGVTTDVSNTGTREVSVVRCQDSLFESIALTLENADLIGDPITSDTTTDVKSMIIGVLENALDANILQAYTDVVVAQGVLPGGDPTVISVTFSYYPTYPLNYVTVTFTLDLTTGNLQATSDNSGGDTTTT